MQDVIVQAIFASIDEHNAAHPDCTLEKSMVTVLYGREAHLSSLQFVGLVLSVEEQLERALGRRIVLADDKAFSERASPFRTVGSLASFIANVSGSGL